MITSGLCRFTYRAGGREKGVVCRFVTRLLRFHFNTTMWRVHGEILLGAKRIVNGSRAPGEPHHPIGSERATEATSCFTWASRGCAPEDLELG
jgi:hypothetical protein